MVVTLSEQMPHTQRQAVQEQVVSAARLQWPLLFSKLFEVTTLSGEGRCGRGTGKDTAQGQGSLTSVSRPGPRLPKTKLILAVNWKGLFLLDQQERVLLELSFPEIMSLVANRWVPLLGSQSLGLWERQQEGGAAGIPSGCQVRTAMDSEGVLTAGHGPPSLTLATLPSASPHTQPSWEVLLGNPPGKGRPLCTLGVHSLQAPS